MLYSRTLLFMPSLGNSLHLLTLTGEGNGTPLQYSCLENPMHGGAWKAVVHGVAEGRTWLTSLSLFTFMHWRRKWQPTPVFLPGESQGWGSLVGCHLWGRTELDTTERLSCSSSSSSSNWTSKMGLTSLVQVLGLALCYCYHLLLI